jgi:hypothetical protein
MSIVYRVRASKHLSNGRVDTLGTLYEGPSLPEATDAYAAYEKPRNVRARVMVGLTEWENEGGLLKHKLYASLSVRREA